MKHCWLIICMIFPAALCLAEPQRTSYKIDQLTVGSLLDTEINYGCGCDFTYPGHEKEKGADILQWEEGQPASMFIEGELIKLKVEAAMPDSNELGSKMTISLAGPETKVTGTLLSTWVCPPEEKACENSEFMGTIHVEHAGRKAELKVWASCGC